MKKTLIFSLAGLLFIGIISYVINNYHSLLSSQDIPYPVVENQYLSYGPITGLTSIDYQGKHIATLHRGIITYFSGMLTLPSDLFGWTNTHSLDNSNNNLVFLNADYGPIGDNSFNYSGRQIILINGSNKVQFSLKDICYDDNQPEIGGKVAESIEQKMKTISGIDVYVTYRTYDKDFWYQTEGSICTVLNGNSYIISIKNYSKEETYAILNSFHFIQ